MKSLFLLSILNLVVLFSKAQPEKELVLLTVKNDRLELTKAIKFLNANDPRLICVNFDLTNCDDVKQFPSNHFSNSGDTTAVIRQTESEKRLSRELAMSRSLLMPSELRPFGSKAYDEIIGCGFLYPEKVATGFVNLINSSKVLNQVEKIQISNTYKNEPTVYHFAVNIALQLNESATRSYIKSHPNVVALDFARSRKFKTYSMEHFYGNKESGKALKGKVIILGVDQSVEYHLVPTAKGNKKMSTSEIFANIVCQLIE
ncbi:MAG: CHASE2 domain-containing protein [Verrucomicrobia bacterium]|nr:CHASE2 domain-containing protein [Verrucomicrobiota bacterium]